MSGDFQVFRFRERFPVRISDREGAPWFVAADVCKALAIVNPRKAVTQLDDDEHMTVTFSDGRPGHGAQKINIVSESGLYALVIRSNKPEARSFRKWITAEVLPAIRRHGAYALAETEIGDPADDPAKRSTAELVEQTNRRLAAGENIPPHVLQYVSNIARIASGIWYRDCFGVDGRAAKLPPGGCWGELLPGLSPEEDRAARRIVAIVRKHGTCNLRLISIHASHLGMGGDERRRLIAKLIDAGLLQCSGEPCGRGSTYRVRRA